MLPSQRDLHTRRHTKELLFLMPTPTVHYVYNLLEAPRIVYFPISGLHTFRPILFRSNWSLSCFRYMVELLQVIVPMIQHSMVETLLREGMWLWSPSFLDSPLWEFCLSMMVWQGLILDSQIKSILWIAFEITLKTLVMIQTGLPYSNNHQEPHL